MGGYCCILKKNKSNEDLENEHSDEDFLYDIIKSSNINFDEYINNNWEKIEWDDDIVL